MQKTSFKYFALWGFLIGIIFIVFLQFISGRNINRLIVGNQNLLSELKIQNHLREIESDILNIESDVRGAVISQNTAALPDIDSRIAAIEHKLGDVEKLLTTKNTAGELQQLDRLVHQKIVFTHQILNTFHIGGKQAAEDLINTNKGKRIRDSIVQIIYELDTVRQNKLHLITRSIEKSGVQALTWGIILSAMACFFLIVVFLYIINQSTQQQKIIKYLNESEKKIKEAAQLKEQFMANMSHEIRTPMNSIIGFTNLLKRTALSESQRQYVQNIHSAGENLLVLINDILDLSKIEAGMMHLEDFNFSLRSLISSVTSMFTERIKEKKLALNVYIDPDTPDILCGDAVRLTQILVNLLSNAVKFTDQGEIGLKVTTLYSDEESAQLKIIISDSGIGIPKEKQATIFERFQQADSETTRKFGGTGLGLSIVKQLVQLQGGDITLKSEQGVGSEFIVELEFKIPNADELLSNAIAAEEHPVMLNKIKVLIAEDNAMNQQLIRHLMKSWNIECAIVDNGEEAVELLKKQSFSIVLMDIQMPVMDGYTATSVIRKELKMDIPIIAMTAHAMMGEKEKCLQLGMNDYVSKPLKETVLYNMIAQYSHSAAEEITDPEKTNGQEPVFQHINLDYLQELSGNDEDFERAMMEQFAKQTPEELRDLQSAIDKQDFPAIRRVAHSLKSTVGYMGLADELHPYANRMEKAATAQDIESIRADFRYFKGVTEAAIDEITRYLQLQ